MNSRKKNDENVEAMVDRHLKSAYHKMFLSREMLALQLRKQAIQPGDDVFKIQGKEIKALHSVDKGMERLVPPADSKQMDGSISFEIYERLKHNQDAVREEQFFRQHYIWEFRKNAWYGGYDVRVDAQGKVISVRELSPQERNKEFPDPEPRREDF